MLMLAVIGFTKATSEDMRFYKLDTVDGESKVVIFVDSLKRTYNDDDRINTVRIKEFGLSASSLHFSTPYFKLKRMISSLVYAHSEIGNLNEWLDGIGVWWYWQDRKTDFQLSKRGKELHKHLIDAFEDGKSRVS